MCHSGIARETYDKYNPQLKQNLDIQSYAESVQLQLPGITLSIWIQALACIAINNAGVYLTLTKNKKDGESGISQIEKIVQRLACVERHWDVKCAGDLMHDYYSLVAVYKNDSTNISLNLISGGRVN